MKAEYLLMHDFNWIKFIPALLAASYVVISWWVSRFGRVLAVNQEFLCRNLDLHIVLAHVHSDFSQATLNHITSWYS